MLITDYGLRDLAACERGAVERGGICVKFWHSFTLPIADP
jgi:hypothetical protein